MCNLTWKLKRSIPALEVTQYLPFKARQFAKYTNTYWDAFGRFKLGLPCCRTKLLTVELAQDNTTCRHYYHYHNYFIIFTTIIAIIAIIIIINIVIIITITDIISTIIISFFLFSSYFFSIYSVLIMAT